MSRFDLYESARRVLGVVLEAKRPISYTEIREALDMTAPTVTRAAHRLDKLGLVDILSRPSPTGHGRECLLVAPQYIKEAVPPQPEPDWPERVPKTARAIYAAILELAPDASYTTLMERLGLARSVVNANCEKLAAVGAIVIESRNSGGHRVLVAYPNRGAETLFREYRASHLRPDWGENLSETALLIYRILYHRGPMLYREIVNDPAFTRGRSMVLKGLFDLGCVGAVKWEEEVREGYPGGPVRRYRAVKGSIGPIGRDEAEVETMRVGAAYGKVYRPPTKGRSRYRKLGRGVE